MGKGNGSVNAMEQEYADRSWYKGWDKYSHLVGAGAAFMCALDSEGFAISRKKEAEM